MPNVVQALLQSRKAWVVLLAIVGVVVMELVGKISSQSALDAIKWLVTAWLGAQAAEDSAGKVGVTNILNQSAKDAMNTKDDTK